MELVKKIKEAETQAKGIVEQARTDAAEKAGANVGNTPTHVLGKLLAYEPRIVLSRYQRLLPADINERLAMPPNFPKRTGPAGPLKRIFQSHRKTAPARITLTVQYADHNGVLVDYQVVFRDYPKIIEQWQREQQNPRARPADGFGNSKTFRLSFATLPTTEGFGMPDYVKQTLAPATATAPLVFDHLGRSEGRMILKWSDQARRRLDLYLVATLKRQCPGGRAWSRAVPPEQVYMEPVQVTMDRDGTKPR